MARFEGRSLLPDQSLEMCLMHLGTFNFSEKYNDLIEYQRVVFRKVAKKNKYGDYVSTQQHKTASLIERLPVGYTDTLEDIDETYLKNLSNQCKDNQVFIRLHNVCCIITLNDRYKDIVPLIANKYVQTVSYEENKNATLILLPVVILSLSLIVAMIIYAYANRYEIKSYTRIDKWTGTYELLHEK